MMVFPWLIDDGLDRPILFYIWRNLLYCCKWKFIPSLSLSVLLIEILTWADGLAISPSWPASNHHFHGRWWNEFRDNEPIVHGFLQTIWVTLTMEWQPKEGEFLKLPFVSWTAATINDLQHPWLLLLLLLLLLRSSSNPPLYSLMIPKRLTDWMTHSNSNDLKTPRTS